MLARRLCWIIAVGLVCVAHAAYADIARRDGQGAPTVTTATVADAGQAIEPAGAKAASPGGTVAGGGGPWFDDIEAYAVGSSLHGQGGWKGWDNSPAATAYVDGAHNHTDGGEKSIDIAAGSDLVHEYSGHNSGVWLYSTWQFVPSSLSAPSGTYFLIQKEYNDGGPYQWSVQLQFLPPGTINCDCGDGTISGTYVANQWARIDVYIDLTNDWTLLFYNGEPFHEYRWTHGVFGDDTGCPDVGCIGSVDLYANAATSVYYDDLSLTAVEGLGACCSDGTTCTNGFAEDCTGTFYEGMSCADHTGFLCPNPACTPDSGDCFEPNDTPGCYQPEAADPTLCCTTVCANDSWCCNVIWDSSCANQANDLCIPPPNDNCGDAEIIDLQFGVPQLFTGENAGATGDCGLLDDAEAWIAFTVPDDADVTLELCSTTPVFSLYSETLVAGCPCEALLDTGPQNVCFDGNAMITWPCIAAGTYYYPILTGPGGTGNYTISVTAAPAAVDCTPPPNDNCEDADHFDFPSGGGTHQYTGNNLNATRDCDQLSDPTGFPWISFSIAEASEITIDFCDQAVGFFTNYRIITATCPCSGLIFFDTDGFDCPNGNYRFHVPCQSAGTYYYPIYSHWDGSEGDYVVNVTVDPTNCEEECGGSIVSADPPAGTEDARQPHNPGAGNDQDPALRQGIGSADEPIMLSVDANGLAANCFTLCETAPDPILGANGIASVTEDPPGTYAVVLNHAAAPGGWTSIGLGATSVAYLAHPANVNADDLSNANDVLALINMLNGVEQAPFGMYSMDVDHSGAANASDILRTIDLLNGATPYATWLGVEKPTNTCP